MENYHEVGPKVWLCEKIATAISVLARPGATQKLKSFVSTSLLEASCAVLWSSMVGVYSFWELGWFYPAALIKCTCPTLGLG